MEYESSQTPLGTNLVKKNAGTKIGDEKIKQVQELIKEGKTTQQIMAEVGTSDKSVGGIRKRMREADAMDVSAWKKNTSRLMAEIVTRGSERLLEEIDDIPLSSLPIAIAIMTDKHQQLQDAPTVVVEHRLRIKHEDINSLIKGEIVDIPAVDPSDKKD